MPTNLPPQYFEVEKKLKSAREPSEKIAVMEDLLAIIPKHKGTEKIRALYKTKIAKLKLLMQKKPSVSKPGAGHHIEKAGAGQVILVGPPNSGKSSLLAALTNAEPAIGDYPFTTHASSPAMMKFENVQIQLIDTPPITRDTFEFWQAEQIKNADGVLFLLDLGNRDTGLDFMDILEQLREKRIDLIPPESGMENTPNLFSRKTLLLANKNDLSNADQHYDELQEFLGTGLRPHPVSALDEKSMEDLKKRIWELLNVLRVYSKSPGRKPDRDTPFVFPRGSTLMDMAKSVHRDFARNLKYARLWSEGKYQGQMVQRNYRLEDEDIIELHL